MRKRADLAIVDGDQPIQLEGRNWKLIPPGEYEAEYLHHETDNKAFASSPKVYLHFKLIDPGVMGTVLYKPFNAKSLVGKVGKNGKFTLSRRMDLTFLLCDLNHNLRLDRVSLNVLKGGTWKVRVRTVSVDSRQRKLPPQLQYSVIATILRKEYGG
jgi:hypothetical protein